MREQDTGDHVELNRWYWDEVAAAAHGPLARGQWSAPEPAYREYPEVAASWTRRWPGEEIRKARLTAALARGGLA
jgi:hypothetical protein